MEYKVEQCSSRATTPNHHAQSHIVVKEYLILCRNALLPSESYLFFSSSYYSMPWVLWSMKSVQTQKAIFLFTSRIQEASLILPNLPPLCHLVQQKVLLSVPPKYVPDMTTSFLHCSHPTTRQFLHSFERSQYLPNLVSLPLLLILWSFPHNSQKDIFLF